MPFRFAFDTPEVEARELIGMPPCRHNCWFTIDPPDAAPPNIPDDGLGTGTSMRRPCAERDGGRHPLLAESPGRGGLRARLAPLRVAVARAHRIPASGATSETC